MSLAVVTARTTRGSGASALRESFKKPSKKISVMKIEEYFRSKDSFYTDAEFMCLYPINVFSSMTLKDKSYISYSEINTFLQCKLKYLVNYILGIRFFTVNKNAFFGTVVHDMMATIVRRYFENHHNNRDIDERAFFDIAKSVYYEYADLFDPDRYYDEHEFVKTIIKRFYRKNVIKFDIVFSDLEDVRILLSGKNLMKRDWVKNAVKNSVNLVVKFFKFVGKKRSLSEAQVSCEHSVSVDLDFVKFYGIVDLLVEFDDIAHIADWKFGRMEYVKWSQLFFYSLAFQKNTNKYLIFPMNNQLKVKNNAMSRDMVLYRLKSYEKMIKEFYDFYNSARSGLKKEYAFLVENLQTELEKTNSIVYYPLIAIGSVLRIIYLLYLQSNIQFLNEDDSKLCPFCEYYMYCPHIINMNENV